MSSKIKVDTIENVAGSGNVSLGSGHNLVVPGTLAITGASTLTGATTIGGDLTVDTSTLKVDASNNRVGVGTTSPDGALHVKGMSDHGRIIVESGGNTGSSNNTFIQFHNNGGTEVSQITVEETATNEGQMVFKTGGTTTAMTIDKDGHITQPLQPAFFARVQSGSAMTDLAVNTYHTVTFNEEIFDQNADYNNSTYTFTAPVTGRYHFDCRLYLLEVPSNTTYIYFSLVTSNNDILMHINDVDSDQYYDFLQGSVLVDMDANDTAFVRFYQPNGSATTHIHHVSSIFSGHLVA